VSATALEDERPVTTPNSPIRDYQSAADFLFGRINYEQTRRVPYRSEEFKLQRMQDLAAHLGHPEQSFPAVHIAGTKGKGSTSAMIASILQDAGYRCGLYTSPHLHRLEERFVVNGQTCDEASIVAVLARIEPIIVEMDAEAQRVGRQGPTYFEVTTAVALEYFRQQAVDVAVLEVGLGGRLDSTNICLPQVTAITSISLDHTRQLGSTLAAIAGEKAGICKPNVPLVTGVTEPEPLQVIQQVAANNRAELLALGPDFDFEYLPHVPVTGDPDARISEGACGLNYHANAHGVRQSLDQVALGMLGRHQAVNASVALAICGVLSRKGWRISESAMRSGLARASCPARIEVLSQAPPVVLDTAHNPASVAALLSLLEERFSARPKLLLYAASHDKDSRSMLEQLLPHFDHVVLTRFLGNPRAAKPQQLLALAESIRATHHWSRPNLYASPDPASAWQLLVSHASPQDLICITGSFFLAAETRGLAEAYIRSLATNR
jgi:dihydrofolate synthase/folylpolyglutamate synthase